MRSGAVSSAKLRRHGDEAADRHVGGRRVEVVVEPHVAVRVVGEVGDDVARPDVGPAVADVLGMDQRDVVDLLLEAEEDGTRQPV